MCVCVCVCVRVLIILFHVAKCELVIFGLIADMLLCGFVIM